MEACLEAISLLARTEGIFLDPTSTGKAMAGLISHIRQGKLHPVVFLQSGGHRPSSPMLTSGVNRVPQPRAASV